MITHKLEHSLVRVSHHPRRSASQNDHREYQLTVPIIRVSGNIAPIECCVCTFYSECNKMLHQNGFGSPNRLTPIPSTRCNGNDQVRVITRVIPVTHWHYR